MAYNEFLADQIRLVFSELHVKAEEKKMFGGYCFLVDNKLCCGVFKEDLMVRIAPEDEKKYLDTEDCRMMDENPVSMRGFLMVGPDGVDMDEDLFRWIQRCLDYNPRAKTSRRKK
jgi:hypothetical protein